MLNKEEPIPIEAAVKYLVRERDKYKEKLDILVPYTKRLDGTLGLSVYIDPRSGYKFGETVTIKIKKK